MKKFEITESEHLTTQQVRSFNAYMGNLFKRHSTDEYEAIKRCRRFLEGSMGFRVMKIESCQGIN